MYIYICDTFTHKIKGKSQCINVILHWLWNVNKIYAHNQIKNTSKGFDAGSETTAAYIEALWNIDCGIKFCKFNLLFQLV